MHKDGFLYNTITGYSVADIASSAPSTVAGGGQGYMYLNGGENTPVLLQWGRVTITPDKANEVKAFPVNFVWRYQGIPLVCSDKATTAPQSVYANVGDITADGFNIYIQRPTVTATSILWYAIGNGTNALPE